MNIENVNSQLVIEKIKEICQLASDVNKSIVKIYQMIKEMRRGWYGNIYDQFVRLANEYVDSLNKDFEVILMQIPTDLIIKMQSYMKNNLTDIDLKEIVLIENIPLTNKGTMLRFMSDIIEIDRLEIEKILVSVNSKCDEILIKNRMIEWDEMNELANKEKIEETIKNIQLIVFKIKDSLRTIISNQQTELDAIENENMEDIAEKIKEDMVKEVQTKSKSIEENFLELFSDLQNNLWNKQ